MIPMFARMLTFIVFVSVSIGVPLVGQAALPDPFIYDTRLIGISTISGAPYGTLQTAFRTGNTPTLQTSVYTRGTTPFVSVEED